MEKIIETNILKNNLYLNNKKNITTLKTDELDISDVALYKVDSITFKKDAPKRQALENVLSTLRIEGVNFIYLILGNDEGIEFYYGVSRDYSKSSPSLNIQEIGEFLLCPSIKGNFRGSKVEVVTGECKRKLLDKIKNNQYQSIIEGVPGILENKDEFQGVDRLADTMGINSEFGFMIIASLVDDKNIADIEKNIFDIYDMLNSVAKQSKQESQSENFSTNKSKSIGTNESKTTGTNENESRNETTNSGESKQSGTSESKILQTSSGSSKGESSYSTNKASSESKSTTTNSSITITGEKSQTISKNIENSKSKTSESNENETTGTSEGTTKSITITTESTNKQMQDWVKYIDEILLPRIDYGKGKGLFTSSMFCFANSKAVLQKLENTIISLFSGESGNKLPLRAFLLDNGKRLHAFRNLQLPKIQMNQDDEKISSLFSQSSHSLGNLISSKELSLIADLPKKEVVGLELNEEVEFGLNYKQFSQENSLVLGKLIQSGNITNKEVSINKFELDKHIFITGITGSGKTTTCQNILINSNKPFLVIEPAKTEYRILKNIYDDLLIFTLGNDTLSPFRLNPFEFFPHESITSRVDMIKASIEAAFDMEAAIPQIIESAIYECYKDKGWNISTNKNEIYEESAFDEGVYSFPTLQDLIEKIEDVVKTQGFDERLKNDYIGSIKARLNGLLVGSKGFMLNTKRSIDFRKLLDKKVVFELEEIRNGNEKSLVMGFILTNFVEAIKANFKTSQNKHGLKHILLIEEAHRLLSKYEAGDSLNKKQGVEVFTDMLAEIRKYGECLMIADQIPNKLTPEVLKNTNTKIVHRIFAADDKKAIANTIALEDEQAEFLSKLDIGTAIVFSGGFSKAVAVKINQSSNTTSNELINEEIIQHNIYNFYAKNYKDGVILGSAWLENADIKTIENLLNLQRRNIMKALKDHYDKKQKIAPKILENLKPIAQIFDLTFLARFFILENNLNESKLNIAYDFLHKYLNNSIENKDVEHFKNNLF
ncbi:ATP-binding protein [Campylobacter lari]|uniref:ATP-binding protein n=1 Tax=Campylobacter lari TaxID=201 RepID=UPI0012715525|nr:ATP-binding protein [Campylobacter lari]ECK1947545.1 ATP-binding protein [Campylobacter lari]MBT0818390.1 ATP-binding protein [Campylobacter lari]MBT0832860.1 ATP-binding protein [Campylobacter lari]